MTLLAKAYRDGWVRERKLHLIWRAIARRRAVTIYQIEVHPGYRVDNDGESDP